MKFILLKFKTQDHLASLNDETETTLFIQRLTQLIHNSSDISFLDPERSSKEFIASSPQAAVLQYKFDLIERLEGLNLLFELNDKNEVLKTYWLQQPPPSAVDFLGRPKSDVTLIPILI